MSMTVAWTARASEVNGPEGNSPTQAWYRIDWPGCERNVRRLRQRIFKASREGDLKKVRNLQKLMLRSRSNTLVSVKRVTQQSSGRKTAGIDGERASLRRRGPNWQLTAAGWPLRGRSSRSSACTSQGERQAAPARYPGHP
ncbi:reverse transcriptase N-terminal domain-containing protein [Streptomyces sp. M19]